MKLCYCAIGTELKLTLGSVIVLRCTMLCYEKFKLEFILLFLNLALESETLLLRGVLVCNSQSIFLAAFVIADSDTCCSVWVKLFVLPWLSVILDLHKQNQINPAYLIVPITVMCATHYSTNQTRF